MNTELGEYVGQLLYENDCVIIPDFGGIVANYKPAIIHPGQDLFKPPTKQLSFNIKLKNNDGLLINHIAQSESLDYKSALDIVSKGVKAYQLMLDTDGLVNIVSVGKIFKDKEGNLNFEADASENFLPSSFGLTGISFPKIKRDEEKFSIEAPLKKAGKGVKFPSKKLLAAAVAVPLLFAGSYLFRDNIRDEVAMSSFGPQSLYERTYKPRSGEPEIIVEAVKENTFFEDNKNTVAPLYINSDMEPVMVNLVEKERIVAEPVAAVTTVTSPVEERIEAVAIDEVENVKGNYHIIGGSFAKKKNATKLVNSLIESGYDAEIIGQSGSGSYRVSYGAYTDLKSANYNLLVIQVNFNKGAWLLKN